MNENLKSQTEPEDLSEVEDLVGDISYIINDGRVDGNTLAGIIARNIQDYLHIGKCRQQWNLQIQKLYSKNISLYFSGSLFTRRNWFPSEKNYIDFSNFEFPEVNFSDIYFRDNVNFQKAIFKQKADFQNIQFQSDANFQNSKFQKEVNFQNISFQGETHFTNIKISKRG